MRSFFFACAILAAAAPRSPEILFQSRLLDPGANEAAAIADINGDGKLDIVSGENWYQGPAWTRHHFRDLSFTNNYIDDFSDLPLDVDGDGKLDIVSVSWFGKKMSWWRNPGKIGVPWPETIAESGFNIEFAFLVDLNNDGKANEVLPQFGETKAPLAWYEAKGGKLEKHVVAPQSYGHGIGAGDVNKDGKADILTPKGWFEAPAWKFHPDWDETEHLGFLFVLDVNDDGRPDIVTSYAHNYGIFWLEQTADHKFVKHMIDDSWSQPHAVTLVDLNGDGRVDILTGKRYMAHNGRDPGEREPLGIYWYENTRDGFTRHVIEYSTRAGGGMQIPVADLNGDGRLDFVTPGKSGLFLFLNNSGDKPLNH
jgi:hypothetical protein